MVLRWVLINRFFTMMNKNLLHLSIIAVLTGACIEHFIPVDPYSVAHVDAYGRQHYGDEGCNECGKC